MVAHTCNLNLGDGDRKIRHLKSYSATWQVQFLSELMRPCLDPKQNKNLKEKKNHAISHAIWNVESCVPIKILLNHHSQKWSYWVGLKSSTWKNGVFKTLRRGNHCRECGNIYNTHARLLASTFWYWKYSHGIQEGSGKHHCEICQTHHKEKNMPWHQTLATTVK